MNERVGFQRTACRVLAALLLAAGAATVAAQSYPSRAVRIVVPFPAGGPSDYAARVMSQRLTEHLGQPVVIDNRAGAAGAVGAELVAKSPGDGYTLLIANVGMLAVSPHLTSKLGYDTFRDFTPISNLVGGPSYLVLHPSIPARNVRELIALAKKRPGELTYASAGNGQISHMNGELFKLLGGVNLVHVPYKGAAPILPELVGGQTSLTFATSLETLQFVKEGRIRLIAVTGKQRAPNAPDTPTVSESGIPGFEALNWNGIVAPAKLPADALARLSRDVMRAITAQDVKDKILATGNQSIGDTPEQFAAYIRAEYDKWGRVVKQAGIKPD